MSNGGGNGGGGSGGSGNFSSLEFIHTLNKYIPSLVLQQWIDKVDVTKMILPELQTQETVVLFADISGFTNISEACALMGVRGNEELAFCINRYMEGMVKALGKYGGDIIKFVGDAMIVMWPRINHQAYAANYGGGSTSSTNINGSGIAYNSPLQANKQSTKDHGDDRVTVIRKAIQCALEIQNELNDKKIMNNVTNLSVKIGIGYGECALLYVGGVFNRAEFFTVGQALTSALQSEENATAGGQIVVSQSAYQFVEQYFQSDEIVNDHGKKFYKILNMHEGIRMRADAVLLRNLIQADNFVRIQNKLKACIPAAIMPYLEIGYEQYGSETRRLSIMFASLGVDLSSAQTVQGMNKIQKIVTTVQQQVYRLEGSVNKLVMDDKGSTLICIWGLSPFAHEDDAARAILTAMNIRRELAKIENTWCNVGISTGEVFSGVVGTSGSRKEFSVLGDYVNLAARIMYHPKKYKLTGKIYVDLQTKKEADNYLRFIYQCHSEFKGKSTSLPIFEPLDPIEELQLATRQILAPDVLLKIHSNPFLVDRNSEYKRKVAKQIGRQDLMYTIQEDLIEYFDPNNRGEAGGDDDVPYMLAIHGESGSGKTLFAKCLIDSLKSSDEFLTDHCQEELPFLTSALNAESQMRFLNGWRPILQTMLFIHCKRNGLTLEKYVAGTLLKGYSQDKADIILDLFGIKSNISKYLYNASDPLAFVKREKHSDEMVDVILDILIDFIIQVINDNDDDGEDDYYNDEESSRHNGIQSSSLNDSQYTDYHRNHQRNQQENSYRNRNRQSSQYTPLILIFDTVYLLDEPSWRLLELVKDECTRIAIILLMQTDTVGQPKVHAEAVGFYQEAFANVKGALKVVDIPPLKYYELEELLVKLSPQYQQQMLEEIFLQTKIDDLKTTIKNPEQCKIKELELKKKHMVSNTFSCVSEELINLVIERCEGNPLTSLNFVYNLITNDFLIIRDFQLKSGRNFVKAQKKSDWSIVPVPAITQKINCTLLDSFLKEMRAKPNKNESENGVKGLLILKSAAVIGDMFGTRALQHICPMRNQSHKSVMALLRMLEQRDFIEVLDETDPKNAICRFRKCLLRETIYQAMLYRDQKKGLHELMAQFIQSNPSSFESDPEIESEKLLNHILISEDIDSEDKVPFKSKQALIVKKVSNLLVKNPAAIIKSGMMTKQGNKPNKNTEHRLVVLRARIFSWYHNEAEMRSNQPLGQIPLQAVYHCVPAQGYKNTSDIIIGTCVFSKKGIEKESKREFIFGARDSIERDEWISCVEYLRAKCIYDNFVSRYCHISFPLKKATDEQSQNDQEDNYNISKDFGSKFKIQARFNHQSPEVSPRRSNSRPTSKRSSKFANRLGSFAQYNIHDTTNSNNQISLSTFNNPKDIAQRIKKLYNTQIATFISHVTSTADKQNHQQSDSIRRIPQVLKNTQLFSGYDEQPPSEMVSIINKHGSSTISAYSNDDYNEASLRRISVIARREVLEDNSEFKQYLEDLKDLRVGGGGGMGNLSNNNGAGNNTMNSNTGIIGDGQSSPRIEHMKITEENEEYSESSRDTTRQPISKRGDYHNVLANSQIKQKSFNEQAFSSILRPTGEELKESNLKDQGSKKSRFSTQLAMGPSHAREMTFRHQQQQQNELQNQQQASTFAINVSPTKQLRKIEQIDEQDESQVGSSPKPKKKRLSRRQKPTTTGAATTVVDNQKYSMTDDNSSSIMESDTYSVRSNYQSQQQIPMRKQDTAAFDQITNSSQQQQQRQFALVQQSKNLELSSQSSTSTISKQQSQQAESVKSSRTRQQLNMKIKQQLSESKNSKISKDNNSINQSNARVGVEDESMQIDQFSRVSQSITSSALSLLQRDPSPSKSVKQKKQESKNNAPESLSPEKRKADQNFEQNNFTMQYASNSQPHKLLPGNSDVQDSCGSQKSGGAASSRKGLQMSQVVSKQANSGAKESIEDDKIADPESQILEDEQEATQSQLRQPLVKKSDASAVNIQTQQQQNLNQQQQQQFQQMSSQQVPYQIQQQFNAGPQQKTNNANYATLQQQRGNQQQLLGHIQPERNPYISQLTHSPLQQFYPHPSQMVPNGYYPPPPMPYYYQSQPYSQLDETNTIPSQFSNTQNMQYMTPTGYMYPTPPYSTLYDPNIPLSAHPIPYMNQHMMNNNNELADYLMFNDSLDREFDGGAQQNLTTALQMSTSINTNQNESQLLQYAIVLEDCQCQLKGELMTLYEGDKVEIVKLLPDMNMAQVKFNKEVGLFPLTTLKIIKRNQVSPEKPGYNSLNGSKLRVSEVYLEKQLSPDQLRRPVTQPYEGQRNNFFKQTPLTEPTQKQSSEILKVLDSSKNNLKLHERLQKRKDRKMGLGSANANDI